MNNDCRDNASGFVMQPSYGWSRVIGQCPNINEKLKLYITTDNTQYNIYKSNAYYVEEG